MFTRFHYNLVLSNSTTIENFDKTSSQFSYNMGKMKNWKQVFGKNPWVWWAPVFGATGKPIGDGVVWPQTFSNEEPRGGYEPDDLPRDNTKVIHLDVSRDDKSLKQSDSDTSFMSNKKILEINLRKN